METKNILLGVGLIGASIFVLPKMFKGEDSSSSGGGGTPSVSMVGFPSGAGGLEATPTKKDAVTNVYNIEAPIIPSESLTAPTKKDNYVISPTEYVVGGKTYTSSVPYTCTAESVGITEPTIKKTPTAPTTTLFSRILNYTRPRSSISIFRGLFNR